MNRLRIPFVCYVAVVVVAPWLNNAPYSRALFEHTILAISLPLSMLLAASALTKLFARPGSG